MGKQWKKDGKTASAAKKGAQISKSAKEIQVATKLGGADPAMNPRLRMAIDYAKANSVPKDTIERAIKKGSGQLEGGEIFEIMYEGFGPHKVGVLVECLSDNKNRTAPEMRTLFKKNDGNLGEIGSVSWMFNRVCLISGSKEGTFDPEEEAIESGANEVEEGDESGTWSFYGDVTELDSIRSSLSARGWNIKVSELSFKANNFTELTEEQLKEVYAFLEVLEDHDDTHRVYASLK